MIVKQEIEVKIDETKFTEEFMEEFRKYFYKYYTINDHIEHLAQGFARGIWDEYSFIEGYGDASDFGISFNAYDAEIEEAYVVS